MHPKHNVFTNYSPVTARSPVICHESFHAAACISTRALATSRMNEGLQSLLSLIKNLTQSDLNPGLNCRPTTHTPCRTNGEPKPARRLQPLARPCRPSSKPRFSALSFTVKNVFSYVLNLTPRKFHLVFGILCSQGTVY